MLDNCISRFALQNKCFPCTNSLKGGDNKTVTEMSNFPIKVLANSSRRDQNRQFDLMPEKDVYAKILMRILINL